MKRLQCLLAAIVAAFPAVALALDPGTAHGELMVDGGEVALTHSYALRQDNAEGLMDGPGLRILLSDRERRLATASASRMSRSTSFTLRRPIGNASA